MKNRISQKIGNPATATQTVWPAMKTCSVMTILCPGMRTALWIWRDSIISSHFNKRVAKVLAMPSLGAHPSHNFPSSRQGELKFCENQIGGRRWGRDPWRAGTSSPTYPNSSLPSQNELLRTGLCGRRWYHANGENGELDAYRNW